MGPKQLLLSILLFFALMACKKEDFAWNLVAYPELSPAHFENNTAESVTIKANCTNDGHDPDTERGICWSATQDPTIENSFVLDANLGTGEFSIDIPWNNSLDAMRHFRAFARNKTGISYSNNLALLNPILNGVLPLVSTQTPSGTGFTTFTCEGSIDNNGGLSIIEYGFCYSSSIPTPTVVNSTVSSNAEDHIGSFSIELSPLLENTTYYVRAFARNALGVNYGNVETFATGIDYAIGDTGPAGGIIFHKKPEASNGWQFMEIAPFDLNNQNWCYVLNATGVAATDIGDGLQNTLSIIAQHGGLAQASYYCNTLSYGGYSDWFLPSLGELQAVYYNVVQPGLFSMYTDIEYWSSSEDENFPDNAWQLKFSTGQPDVSTTLKSNIRRVRAVRRF